MFTASVSEDVKENSGMFLPLQSVCGHVTMQIHLIGGSSDQIL